MNSVPSTQLPMASTSHPGEVKSLSLPNDILYAIFLLVTESKSRYRYDSIDWSQRLAPWNLAAACKRWRTICLDSPKLWTDLHYLNHTCSTMKPKWGPYDKCVNEVGLRRYYLALERAKDLPLKVTASIQAKAPECCINMLTIAGFRRRNKWSALKIGFTTAVLISWNRHPTQLTTLQILDFDTYTNGYFYDDPPSPKPGYLSFPRKLASSLPSIRAVRISGWNGELSPSESLESLPDQFPWTSLQALSLHQYTGDADPIITLLGACDKLQSFRLHCHNYTTPPEDATLGSEVVSPIQELEIESITFTSQSPNGPISSIFPYVKTPNLRSMRFGLVCLANFEDEGIVTITDEQAIVGLLWRSACQVTDIQFEFSQMAFNPDSKVLLQELKHVQTLTLAQRVDLAEGKLNRIWDCGDSFLDQLIADDGTPFGLPRLEHLKLRNVTFLPTLLIQIVESRLQDGYTSIATLDIEFSFSEELAHLPMYRSILNERLETAIQSGLQINFIDLGSAIPGSTGVSRHFSQFDDVL